MINADKFKKIAQRIDSYREEMIELQTALSAVPAIGPENGGEGELLKANLLEKRLRELGFKHFRHYDTQSTI